MIHQRPWGTYEVLHTGNGFLLKRIVVNPRQRLSLQSHEYRHEHWVVLGGSGTATNGTAELVIGPNTHVFIPRQATHRITNTGDTELVLVEVQVGDVLREDDIVRYSDDYGRLG